MSWRSSRPVPLVSRPSEMSLQCGSSYLMAIRQVNSVVLLTSPTTFCSERQDIRVSSWQVPVADMSSGPSFCGNLHHDGMISLAGGGVEGRRVPSQWMEQNLCLLCPLVIVVMVICTVSTGTAVVNSRAGVMRPAISFFTIAYQVPLSTSSLSSCAVFLRSHAHEATPDSICSYSAAVAGITPLGNLRLKL